MELGWKESQSPEKPMLERLILFDGHLIEGNGTVYLMAPEGNLNFRPPGQYQSGLAYLMVI